MGDVRLWSAEKDSCWRGGERGGEDIVVVVLECGIFLSSVSD